MLRYNILFTIYLSTIIFNIVFGGDGFLDFFVEFFAAGNLLWKTENIKTTLQPILNLPYLLLPYYHTIYDTLYLLPLCYFRPKRKGPYQSRICIE